MKSIDQEFARDGVSRYFHYVSPSPIAEAYIDALMKEGWRLQAELAVMLRAVSPVPPPDMDIRVLAGDEQSGDPLLDRNVAEAHAFGGVTFGAFLEGRLVGTGAVKAYGEIGYLAYGVTSQEFRRKGVQTALIAHRLNWCAAQGLKWAVSETYSFLPSSYDNLLRAGFAESYARPIFTKGSES